MKAKLDDAISRIKPYQKDYQFWFFVMHPKTKRDLGLIGKSNYKGYQILVTGLCAIGYINLRQL